MYRSRITVSTSRGLTDITREVVQATRDSEVEQGLCHVFIHHTSASLIIQENADPSVQHDLESFLSRLVPDGDPRWTHTEEGPDDMPAHVKAAITATSLVIPVEDGRPALGTWQAVYVWEHRTHRHERKVTITVT